MSRMSDSVPFALGLAGSLVVEKHLSCNRRHLHSFICYQRRFEFNRQYKAFISYFDKVQSCGSLNWLFLGLKGLTSQPLSETAT